MLSKLKKFKRLIAGSLVFVLFALLSVSIVQEIVAVNPGIFARQVIAQHPYEAVSAVSAVPAISAKPAVSAHSAEIGRAHV